MLHDKIRTNNEFNNIDSDQITDGNAMCYVGYDNDNSGRISLKINDGSAIRPLAQNAKVVDINLTSITNLNYQNGDIFYVDNVATGNYIITVSNLGGSLLKGKTILLYLNNVPANTTISFGGSEIINSAGSWCATFCNLLGTEVITCMSVWKTPGATSEPEGSEEPIEPDLNIPLTFTAKAATNKIALGAQGQPNQIVLNYSKNNGEWTGYTIGDIIDLASGDTIAFSGANEEFSLYGQSTSYSSQTGSYITNRFNYYNFAMTGQFQAAGNIQSLLNYSESVPAYSFRYLFANCSSLLTAPSLPAKELYGACYCGMFSGCTSLTTPPTLQATNFTGGGHYESMFEGCTSLTACPNLPAVQLSSGCYTSMFQGCTSLVDGPAVLPATIIGSGCYNCMFYGCTSLTGAPIISALDLGEAACAGMFAQCSSLSTAPQLPATGVATACYNGMFAWCTSLIHAPSALPAMDLGSYCYQAMFNNCTALTSAPQLPATGLASQCYDTMFINCYSLTNTPSSLPATTLCGMCYANMFNGCSSLVTPPALPATELFGQCYQSMFLGCTKLTSLSVAFTDWKNSAHTTSWVYNVNTEGQFYGPDELSTVYGVNYIPVNWTVINK